MATIRRIVIDDENPGGWYPENQEFAGFPYYRLFFSGPYYELKLPDLVAITREFFVYSPEDHGATYVQQVANAVSTIYVWRAGFISFEPPTAEQIEFAAKYLAGEKSILEFPGGPVAGNLISAGIPKYPDGSFHFQQSQYGSYVTWGDPIEDDTQGDFTSEDAGEVFIGYAGEFSIDNGGNGLTDNISAYRINGFGNVSSAFTPINSAAVDANQTGGAGADQIVGGYDSYGYNYDILRGMAGGDFISLASGSAWIEGGDGFDLVQVQARDHFSNQDTFPMSVDLALGTMSYWYGSATLIGVEAIITGGGNDTLWAGDRLGNGVDIAKPSSVRNSSMASALSLDGLFGIGSDAEIETSTTVPHATVVASASGHVEYYSFSVAQAGSSVTVDVDHATFDTVIRILDSSDAFVTENDDAALDPGSLSGLDSFLTFEIAAPGRYFIEVSAFPRQAVLIGEEYTLNVSVEGARSIALSYTLYGNQGNDTLISGTGDDWLFGGAGDDVYFVDAAADVVVEDFGQGNDRVVASASFALGATASVETLETTSIGGTAAINLTGSDFDNIIQANNGANFLSGGGGGDTLHAYAGNDYLFGGTGLDNMYGGAGDDAFYMASDDGDRVWEFAGEGYDVVSTEVNFTLPDVSGVDRLEAGTLSATTALYLGGSNLDNFILGNADNNTLRGYGGNDTLHGLGGDDVLIGDEGADVMYGEGGNDTYYINTSDDRIFESVGEGTADRAAIEVSYALPDEGEIETLEAVNSTSTGAMDLTGSRFANLVVGNNGANRIDGKGGNDVLVGLGGADTFVFSTALGAGNIDRVEGFVAGSDKIALDDAVFTAIAPGALAAGVFAVATAAQDSNDRIIYNSATGALFYDPDGTGGATQVQFATLGTGLSLSGSDFLLI